MSTITTFDLARFARAAEERDAATQLSMYGPDATVTIVDKVSQPGSPRVLSDRGEIKGWLEDTSVSHVNPGQVAQRHVVTVDHQLISDLPPQGPQRASQAGARALVEHVRPESVGELGARHGACGLREVGEQRPWPLGNLRVDRGPIELDFERPNQTGL